MTDATIKSNKFANSNMQMCSTSSHRCGGASKTKSNETKSIGFSSIQPSPRRPKRRPLAVHLLPGSWLLIFHKPALSFAWVSFARSAANCYSSWYLVWVWVWLWLCCWSPRKIPQRVSFIFCAAFFFKLFCLGWNTMLKDLLSCCWGCCILFDFSPLFLQSCCSDRNVNLNKLLFNLIILMQYPLSFCLSLSRRFTVPAILNCGWNTSAMSTAGTTRAIAALVKRMRRRASASAPARRDFGSAWSTTRRPLTPHRSARTVMWLRPFWARTPSIWRIRKACRAEASRIPYSSPSTSPGR